MLLYGYWREIWKKKLGKITIVLGTFLASSKNLIKIFKKIKKYIKKVEILKNNIFEQKNRSLKHVIWIFVWGQGGLYGVFLEELAFKETFALEAFVLFFRLKLSQFWLVLITVWKNTRMVKWSLFARVELRC
jgi:hypothetical protein